MFGCCTALKELCGGLEHARIQNVLVSREDMTMEIDAVFASRPEAGELSRLENAIAGEFGLRSVFIRADYPREATAKKKEEKKKEKGSAGTALLGKLPKSERSIPIRDVTLESGTVTVQGLRDHQPQDRQEQRRRAGLRRHRLHRQHCRL